MIPKATEVRQWINNCNSHFTGHVITYPSWVWSSGMAFMCPMHWYEPNITYFIKFILFRILLLKKFFWSCCLWCSHTRHLVSCQAPWGIPGHMLKVSSLVLIKIGAIFDVISMEYSASSTSLYSYILSFWVFRSSAATIWTPGRSKCNLQNASFNLVLLTCNYLIIQSAKLILDMSSNHESSCSIWILEMGCLFQHILLWTTWWTFFRPFWNTFLGRKWLYFDSNFIGVWSLGFSVVN